MSDDSTDKRAVGAHPESFSGRAHRRWTSWTQADPDPTCFRSCIVDTQHRGAVAHAIAPFMPRGAERHATTRSKCQVMKFARQIGRGVGTNRLRLSIRERSGPYKKQHAAAACCLKRHAKHKSRWIATSIVPDTVFRFAVDAEAAKRLFVGASEESALMRSIK